MRMRLITAAGDVGTVAALFALQALVALGWVEAQLRLIA
jgi:hypothetical protein